MINENLKRANFNAVANPQTNGLNPCIGFDLMRWKVNKNAVSYHRSDCHTLSLYLNGGETSYRTDKKSNKGGAGRFCLMPQDHDSHWHINGEIDFVHLYFENTLLTHFASSTFDVDIRFIELQDLLYKQDAQLLMLFRDFWVLKENSSKESDSKKNPLQGSLLLLEEKLQELLHYLLSNHNGFALSGGKVSGGLSPHHRRVIKDTIEQLLGEKLSIEFLAREIGLSAFHFARMFKVSFGESPASYINRRRVAFVKKQLINNQPLAPISLAQISTQSGFSHQSHMTATFKRLTGVTPALYR